jgi:hypothetical protein
MCYKYLGLLGNHSSIGSSLKNPYSFNNHTLPTFFILLLFFILYFSYIYWLKHHMVFYFDKEFILQWKPSLRTKPTFKPTHFSPKYINGKPNLVWSFHDFITNFHLLFMIVMSYVRSMFSKKKLKVLIFKVRKKPKL